MDGREKPPETAGAVRIRETLGKTENDTRNDTGNAGKKLQD
jgi:hypothetical protein